MISYEFIWYLSSNHTVSIPKWYAETSSTTGFSCCLSELNSNNSWYPRVPVVRRWRKLMGINSLPLGLPHEPSANQKKPASTEIGAINSYKFHIIQRWRLAPCFMINLSTPHFAFGDLNVRLNTPVFLGTHQVYPFVLLNHVKPSIFVA